MKIIGPLAVKHAKKKKNQIGYLEYSPLMIKIHNFDTSVFLRVRVIKE